VGIIVTLFKISYKIQNNIYIFIYFIWHQDILNKLDIELGLKEDITETLVPKVDAIAVLKIEL
jgi:hypothetical protein